jgi:hypothetical protein
MNINILEEVTTISEMVELLKHIAQKVDEGYTSGYYPHWSVELTEQEKLELQNQDNDEN